MPETKESSPAEIEKERWEHETLQPALDKHPERKKSFQTVSLEEVDRLYTPADTANLDFDRDISFPGEFPYTRGIHPTGYRGKLWTMRQFAGFSTPEETNARFKSLLQQGQTGLSVAYDLPTLMGYDADSPLFEHLHRDQAIELGIVRGIDLAHAARAEPSGDPVATDVRADAELGRALARLGVVGLGAEVLHVSAATRGS